MHAISNQRLNILRAGLLAAAAAFSACPSTARDADYSWGTSKAPIAITGPHNVVFAPPGGKPLRVYQSASYGTGGVALRNRSTGAIHVSGVVGPTVDAWLYWVVLDSSPPTATQPIQLKRLYPSTATINLKGKLIATPADPCWGSLEGAVYRAEVKTSFATGNGLYQVNLSAGAVGLSDGSDPWLTGGTFPEPEGASLVIIGTGSSTVSLYDYFASEFSGGTFAYTLALPTPTGGFTTMDSWGGDGQYGIPSRTSDGFISADTTTVNSTEIAGTGSGFDPDSDWNGSSGFPLPQLWDDTGHDISAAAPSGTTALKVVISSPEDCIIPVGNIVATQ